MRHHKREDRKEREMDNVGGTVKTLPRTTRFRIHIVTLRVYVLVGFTSWLVSTMRTSFGQHPVLIEAGAMSGTVVGTVL